MKNPILAGVLNVIVPGAGMIYLKKWKDGLKTFFIMAILFIFGKSILGYLAYPYLNEVETTSALATALIFTIRILQGVKVVCMVWVLFLMAYHEARGTEVRKSPLIAILLNFVSAGLGFAYLKKWFLSIAAFLWIAVGTGLISYAYVKVGDNNLLTFSVKFPILLVLGAYLYWDTSVTAYQEARNVNKKLEAKTSEFQPTPSAESI